MINVILILGINTWVSSFNVAANKLVQTGEDVVVAADKFKKEQVAKAAMIDPTIRETVARARAAAAAKGKGKRKAKGKGKRKAKGKGKKAASKAKAREAKVHALVGRNKRLKRLVEGLRVYVTDT